MIVNLLIYEIDVPIHLNLKVYRRNFHEILVVETVLYFVKKKRKKLSYTFYRDHFHRTRILQELFQC